MRCMLPNSAFDEVSLPVSATPSQPRNVPKNGNSQLARVNASPSKACSNYAFEVRSAIEMFVKWPGLCSYLRGMIVCGLIEGSFPMLNLFTSVAEGIATR